MVEEMDDATGQLVRGCSWLQETGYAGQPFPLR